jgi:hypothetical protein
VHDGKIVERVFVQTQGRFERLAELEDALPRVVDIAVPLLAETSARVADDATGAIAVPEPVRKNVLHLRRAKEALGACDARLTGS